MSRWAGTPAIRGNSEAVRMALLTCSTVGISFVWGVEQTYCTAYLLSLGLTKSKTSLVWIAGPLSGLIVQPIVGAIADESKSKWGRRRPYIIVGALLSAFFILVLGFTREIVDCFVSNEESARSITIWLAVLSIYCVDFTINAVMSAARSLVVDTLPIEKQQTGSAWGGRMSAVGHGIAYVTGAIDLPATFGTFFGNTQFKQLTLAAAVGIIATCFLTSWAVTEKVLLDTREDTEKEGVSILKAVRQVWETLHNMPPRIRAICHANFWAWLGWFPFLFYSTTWIGETYFRYDAPEEAQASKDRLGDIGRVGSEAFIWYSIITFAASWLLPFVIRSPDEEGYTKRPPQSIKAIVEALNKHKPDLLTAWTLAHATFAATMIWAPFAHSYRFARLLVCLCSLPWTIAIWAPPAFLGVEVNKLSGAADPSSRHHNGNDIELGGLLSPIEKDSAAPRKAGESSGSGELSGRYMGILNIYTTIPQFMGTIISTVVFSILEPGKSPELAHHAHPDEQHGTDGPNAIAVCLFIGALGAVMAVFQTRKLRYL
ncbi:major facilitator superfamily domain-containing protein [Microdochium bolleyi]|uniref:Major facilitator superfamily domain-containing protein n=1 Tax=Microdochium bolleyi TaxID=196109 RepID=A0A136JEF7_9PEZI|nr:major facilitator superfamily domain-containing protein [Microdochium bolleyi]